MISPFSYFPCSEAVSRASFDVLRRLTRETFVRLLCVGYELGSTPVAAPEVPTLDREIRRVIRTRLYESVELSSPPVAARPVSSQPDGPCSRSAGRGRRPRAGGNSRPVVKHGLDPCVTRTQLGSSPRPRGLTDRG